MKKAIFRSCLMLLACCMVIPSLAGCKKSQESSSSAPSGYADASSAQPADSDGDTTASADGDVSDTGSGSTDSGNAGSTANNGSKPGTGTTANNGSKPGTGTTANNGSKPGTGTTANNGNFDPYKNAAKYRGQTIKVLLWFEPSASEKASIKAFEDKFGIKVNIESTANKADIYATRAAAIIAAKEACDVSLVKSNDLFTNAKNIVKPLDDIATFQKNDPSFDTETMNALKVKNKYYALSVKGNWQNDAEVMYFNPAAFKNRGVKSPGEYYKEGNWNWDTFLECAKAMTYTDKGTVYYGYTMTNWYTFANSAGVDLVSYNGSELKSNINNSTLLSAMKFVNELYNKHKVCSPKFYDNAGFCNGTVAMFSNLIYQMTREQTGFSNLSSGVQVDAVPFPSPKGAKAYTPATYKGFGVMKTSKNPEAAVLFIRWFLDPANDKREFINPGFEALRNKVLNTNKMVPWGSGVLDYGASINYETFLYDCEMNADPAQISTTAQRYDKILNSAIKKCNKVIK